MARSRAAFTTLMLARCLKMAMTAPTSPRAFAACQMRLANLSKGVTSGAYTLATDRLSSDGEPARGLLPVTPISLPGRHLALGLRPLVAGDRLARRTTFLNEVPRSLRRTNSLLVTGIDQLAL